MNDQPQSRTSLAQAVQAEMDDLERRVARYEEQNKELDKQCALLEQDRDQWQRRALDAEASRDRYSVYCVELITRLVNFKDLAEMMSRIFTSIVTDAKRIASKPNGLPAKQVELSEEDQRRVEHIAQTFGYKAPGEEEHS